MLDIYEAPGIGSAEAAVRSCVSLMAAVMGQREELLAYWLDLYYQVRLAYERENAAEPDPTVLRRGDLYPVLRELMQDALKSAVRGEAKERMERKRAKEEAKAELIAENEVMWRSYLQTNGFKDPSTPLRVAQDDREDSGPPRAEQAGNASHASPRVALAPTGDHDAGDDATVAEIMGPQIGIHGPVEGDAPEKLKSWAKKKHDIRDRLLRARDQGVTAAQIRTASDDALTEKEIYGVINAEKTNIEIYRRVEAALDALGK